MPLSAKILLPSLSLLGISGGIASIALNGNVSYAKSLGSNSFEDAVRENCIDSKEHPNLLTEAPWCDEYLPELKGRN